LSKPVLCVSMKRVKKTVLSKFSLHIIIFSLYYCSAYLTYPSRIWIKYCVDISVRSSSVSINVDTEKVFSGEFLIVFKFKKTAEQSSYSEDYFVMKRIVSFNHILTLGKEMGLCACHKMLFPGCAC
jgi:hypothetical protein